MISPRILTSCALVCIAAPATHALNMRAEVSAEWAENISCASGAVDWRDAMRYKARTSLGWLRDWHAGFLTIGEIDAAFEHVPEFSKVSAFTGGIGTTVRQKFGFGAFAPAVALNLGARRREARLNGDDGWTASAALSVGRRLTESWRFGAVTDWQQHYAQSSIFDTRHHRLFGLVTWDINPHLQLSHGNGRLWGDFTANVGPVVWPRALSGALGTNISDYYNTVPWAVTDSYGPGWVTYRVTGRVSFWWLELSPALGRDTSLPLRYESRFSVNKVGVKYRQDIWTLQLLHRF
jgi:hypothetical protein